MAIKNANQEVLMMAMNALMLDMKGTRVNVIPIWGRNTENVLFGIQAPTMIKGYGVTLSKDGVITVVGDSYGQRFMQREFVAKVNHFYKTAAVIKALQNLNYRTQVKVENKKALIEGALN